VRAAALAGVLALAAAVAGAQPLAAAWARSPAAAAAFLSGETAAASADRFWLRTGSAVRVAVPSLPRHVLAVGRGDAALWWRRTGRVGELWREDEAGLRLPLPGGAGSLEAVFGVAGPFGAAWPWGGRLSWRPDLELGRGWDLALRWDVLERRRPWLEHPTDRIRLRRRIDSWLTWVAWGRDRDGRPGLELGAVRRVGASAALEGGRTAAGAPYWAVIARRGGLQVRIAQGWHGLLGVWRSWEVSLCGPGR